MRTEFFLPINPPTTTHQQKKVTVKNGKTVVYESDDLKAARVKLTAHLGQHIPVKKYTGALRVIVKWLFPITDSKKHKDGDWKITKPDTHNLNKLPFDIMTDLGFWTDDAIVVSEIIEKFWAHTPGVYICIEELE